MKIIPISLLIAALAFPFTQANARSLNGFDLDDASIPPTEIYHGGPPRDGIPSIDKPVFIPALDAEFLADDHRVLGINYEGIQRAYPISILNWHELVNDRFNDRSVIVSFCPLCGTGVAFDGVIDGLESTFGVSGLLYNSDVLLYDRQSESLWSQIKAEAISGPALGTKLNLLPVSHTSWIDWRSRFPETTVLSNQTGFRRDYNRDPYTGYYDSNHVMFPLSAESKRYHPKESVLGLSLNGEQRAWPFTELDRAGSRQMADRIGDTEIVIKFDAAHRTANVFTETGEELPGIVSFWFAWYAFHPETSVFTAQQ